MRNDSTELQRKRRQTILEAAAKVFSKVDYHSAQIDEVALLAKVGKGTIYRYFSDKRELYIAAIRGETLKAFEYLEEKTKNMESPVEFITALVSGYVEYFQRCPLSLDIVHSSQAALIDDVIDIVKEVREPSYARFEAMYKKGVLDGSLKAFSPRTVIRIIDSSILHLLYENRQTRSVNTPELLQTLVSVLLTGITRIPLTHVETKK